MQFLVLGYDGKDEGAPARRLAAREAHLKGVRERVEQGVIIYATALLDDDDQMIGSLIICDFPSREALNERWLRSDPYVIGDVWKKIEVIRIQVPLSLAQE